MNNEALRTEQTDDLVGIERRVSSRINVELGIRLRCKDNELGQFRASDLSAGGLRLTGRCDLIFPGDQLIVDFTDFASGDDTLHNMRALVLSRDNHEAHLSWMDYDSLFWVKLLKLLARASSISTSMAESHRSNGKSMGC